MFCILFTIQCCYSDIIFRNTILNLFCFFIYFVYFIKFKVSSFTTLSLDICLFPFSSCTCSFSFSAFVVTLLLIFAVSFSVFFSRIHSFILYLDLEYYQNYDILLLSNICLKINLSFLTIELKREAALPILAK